MLALHKAVMLFTLPAVTPGALRASIDWRMVSSSATQDDMVGVSSLIQLTSAHRALSTERLRSQTKYRKRSAVDALELVCYQKRLKVKVCSEAPRTV